MNKTLSYISEHFEELLQKVNRLIGLKEELDPLWVDWLAQDDSRSFDEWLAEFHPTKCNLEVELRLLYAESRSLIESVSPLIDIAWSDFLRRGQGELEDWLEIENKEVSKAYKFSRAFSDFFGDVELECNQATTVKGVIYPNTRQWLVFQRYSELDKTVRDLVKEGLPITRESYMAKRFPKMPGKWTRKHETKLPYYFQLPSSKPPRRHLRDVLELGDDQLYDEFETFGDFEEDEEEE